MARRAGRAAVFVVAVWALFVGLHAWLGERQARPARADVGRIVALPGGDLQVRSEGDRDAPAIVLLHGYTASLRWWDGVAPALARGHRVVRVDLLGHGGSEKPRDGYSMEQQADRVAAALRAVGVRRATVVGHSMGGMVAVALAERHRRLVERLVTIGTPAEELSGAPVRHRATQWPVVGPAIRSLTPRAVIAREYDGFFTDDGDVPAGRFADDFARMTWRAYRGSATAMKAYFDEAPLDRRLDGEGIPLLAVFGSEDGAVERHQPERFRAVRGTRVEVLPGLGHSPFVERPKVVSDLIVRFAGGT